MKTICFIFFIILVNSCASRGVKQFNEVISETKSDHILLEVPFKKQLENECGPNSLYMVFDYFDDTVPDYSDIKDITFSQKSDGSHTQNMISGARRMGYAAYKVNIDNFSTALLERIPVITFHNLGLSIKPLFHYNVLTGFNKKKQIVTVHDGTSINSKLTFKRFIQSWERGGRWSYVFVPPHIIPSFSNFSEYISNAIVLEKFKKYKVTLDIYKEGVKRWPQRYESYLGQANILYHLDKKSEALQVLEEAVTNKKLQEPALYYNLSVIYKELSYFEKADKAKALALSLAHSKGNKFIETKSIKL